MKKLIVLSLLFAASSFADVIASDKTFDGCIRYLEAGKIKYKQCMQIRFEEGSAMFDVEQSEEQGSQRELASKNEIEIDKDIKEIKLK